MLVLYMYFLLESHKRKMPTHFKVMLSGVSYYYIIETNNHVSKVLIKTTNGYLNVRVYFYLFYLLLIYENSLVPV